MPEKSYVKSLALYYCGREECEKGHAFGPAVRTQYLLHYVVSGKGLYQVGGKSYPVGPGEGFLIRPGELTYYKADDLTPWSYMWIAFDGYEAAEILASCGIGYVMRAVRAPEFEEKMKALIELFGTQNYNEYAGLSIFYGMAAQLVVPRPPASGSFDKEYFDKAAAYIRNNFSYPIAVSDVAKYVGIDRTYLYKIFIAHQGLSPKKFLLSIRVNAAKNMMAEECYSLTEIALSCGFKDVPAFCGHFKRLTSRTPKEFKAEIRENKGRGCDRKTVN